MSMGHLLRKNKKPDVDILVCMKAFDVASGILSFCVDFAIPAAGYACGWLSAMFSVLTFFSSRSFSVLRTIHVEM